jgi:hypothetical protein
LPTGQFEERIVAQSGGIVLIRIATGNLQDPLAQQTGQTMAHRPVSPLAHGRGQRAAQTECFVGFEQLEQSTVAGQLVQIKMDLKRQRLRRKRRLGYGRLDHRDTSLDPFRVVSEPIPERCLPVTYE